MERLDPRWPCIAAVVLAIGPGDDDDDEDDDPNTGGSGGNIDPDDDEGYDDEDDDDDEEEPMQLERLVRSTTQRSLCAPCRQNLQQEQLPFLSH